MPVVRQLVAIVALTAAFAVAAFVVFTALQQPAPSAVSDVKADPAKAMFEPSPKPLPPPPAPGPPKVFGITPTRRTGNVDGGPVD